MNDPWLDFAMQIQSIAQTGLFYTQNSYDRERFEALRRISAEMLSVRTALPFEKTVEVFCCEEGYQTPKVDTRAAIFSGEKILLVHENNGKWSLPGGWCDVDQSIASNAEKETLEEAGLTVKAERLIAVQDWRKHNACNYAFGVIKAFVLCQNEGGEFRENDETTGIGYFAENELPAELSVEKNTEEQIRMCFRANREENWKTLFD